MPIYIVWEGSKVDKALIIAKYEFKIQFKRIGFWIILFIGTALALVDNFPSDANLSRLPKLIYQEYVVSKLLLQPGVILLFGFIFLIANQISDDRKKGMNQIIMTKPLSRFRYVLGKFLGNYILILCFFAIYLCINAFIQAAWSPGDFTSYPYIIAFFCVIVPATLFVVGCSIAFPVFLDIRLVYIFLSMYFMWNLILTPDNDKLPFYLLFGGDLIKLVYKYGLKEPSYFKILLNAIFLVGVGILSISSLLLFGEFWREKK